MSKMFPRLASTQHAKRIARQACHVHPKHPHSHYVSFAIELLRLCKKFDVHVAPDNEWGFVSIIDDYYDGDVEFNHSGGDEFTLPL